MASFENDNRPPSAEQIIARAHYMMLGNFLGDQWDKFTQASRGEFVNETLKVNSRVCAADQATDDAYAHV